MWRTRAVVSLLVEDIAGLKMIVPSKDAPASRSVPPESEPLARASRRARLVIAVDWLALLLLFVFRDPSRSFLPWSPTVDTVFTLGVLAVAAHAGFRWAQLEKYRAVGRVCASLRARDES